ncbi:MAG: oligosaccharide flippase family protein [Candidatus Aenigmarchaeota archaeon]|nr:oligosaccharide flippase family protein [Candidatus Aenigmarchaeota archaeon]
MKTKGSLRSKLVSNVFYVALEWVSNFALSLLYWFLVGKTLVPADYGVVYIFLNLTVLLSGFLPLGTSYALTKLIPEYIGRNELGKITSAIRFTLNIILLMFGILAITFLIFSNNIAAILKVPIYIIWLIPISALFYTLFYHQTSIIIGFQHMRILATTASIGYVLKVVISGILIILGFKFFGPVIGFILSSLFIVLARIKYLLYNEKSIKIDGKSILLTFGMPALLTRMAYMVFTNTESLLLAFFHSASVVGIFGIGMLLSNQMSVISNIFSVALFPITSLLSAGQNTEKKRSRLINLIVRYTLLVTLPLIIFIILFASKLILLFSQASYLPAVSIIPILAVGSLLFGLAGIFTDSLYAIGKPNVQRNLMIIATIIYAILSVPLTYLFSVSGISITYTISGLVLFVGSLIYLRKFLHFSPHLLSIGKLLLANIISFSILFVLSMFAPNIVIAILFAIITGLIYLVVLMFLKFYTKEDVNILEIAHNYLPFGKGIFKTITRTVSKFTSD